MAQLLSFPLSTKPHIAPKHPSGSLSKAWLPSLNVKVTATKRRAAALPIACSLGGDATTSTVVKEPPEAVPASVVLGRSSFPPGFTFGVASSAYQVPYRAAFTCHRCSLQNFLFPFSDKWIDFHDECRLKERGTKMGEGQAYGTLTPTNNHVYIIN